MASTEEKSYEIMRELDVNYVLVIFGGLTGYSSDGEYLSSCNVSLNFGASRMKLPMGEGVGFSE